jgi:hypothetical protein
MEKKPSQLLFHNLPTPFIEAKLGLVFPRGTNTHRHNTRKTRHCLSKAEPSVKFIGDLKSGKKLNFKVQSTFLTLKNRTKILIS